MKYLTPSLLKAFLLLAIISTFGCNRVSTQNRAVPYIATYIRVWGYLKYYHPNIIAGKVNWDSIFLAEYPQVVGCTNREALSNVVTELIRSAGGVSSCGWEPMDSIGDTSLIKNTWIDDTLYLTKRTALSLDSIRSNRVPFTTAYVGFNGEPTFYSDTNFFSDTDPSESIRMLGLARYWNIIEYFAPEKDLIGEPWDSVLERFIPQVISNNSLKAYYESMLKCFSALHDSHSYSWNGFTDSLFGSYALPFKLAWVENQVIFLHSRWNQSTPLLPGDEIDSIDGASVKRLIMEATPYIPASNHSALERNLCYQLLRRNSNDSVRVVFSRGGVIERCEVSPLSSNERLGNSEEKDTIHPWCLLRPRIGYVNMSNFDAGDAEEAFSQLSRSKAIIFDLRNYPHFAIYSLYDYLPILSPWVSYRSADPNRPGTFSLPFTTPSSRYYTRGKYHGKVVVLVNSETQSLGELTAMMLQSVWGSIVVGSQTAGADGSMSAVRLPGGIVTYFSGFGVYYPNGKPTQRIGIIPNVAVLPTIKAIRVGEDEVLNKAIEICNEKYAAEHPARSNHE